MSGSFLFIYHCLVEQYFLRQRQYRWLFNIVYVVDVILSLCYIRIKRLPHGRNAVTVTSGLRRIYRQSFLVSRRLNIYMHIGVKRSAHVAITSYTKRT